MPIEAVPEWNAAITRLAKLLQGDRTDPHTVNAARRIASAQLDIERVRSAKALMIEKFKPTHPLLGLRRRKHPSRKQLLKQGDEIQKILSRPDDPREAYPAIAIPSLSEELGKLDRYERRAISRRKFALREMESSVIERTRS